MLDERLFTWQVIIEDLRARRIDTSVIPGHGKSVHGGLPYDEVLTLATLENQTIQTAQRYSLEEARLL